MKKSDLKSILKPLIEECVKELMFEDGVLSGIIVEVARGVGSVRAQSPATATSVDLVAEQKELNKLSKKQSGVLKEHKQRLMEAVGSGAYNGVDLFEGTSPGPSQLTNTQAANSLSDQPSTDAGVDISNLFGAVGNHWNAHMDETK